MAYTANKLMAQSRRLMVDFDPDATTAVVVTLDPENSTKCLSFSPGITGLVVGIMRSVGTGSVTAARIIVADAADGTGNVAGVVSHAIASAPNAVGDTIWLEATGEQMRAASATAAYVGVEITLVTATDECVVYAELHQRVAGDGLTSDYIS